MADTKTRALDMLSTAALDHYTPHMICVPTDKWVEAFAVAGSLEATQPADAGMESLAAKEYMGELAYADKVLANCTEALQVLSSMMLNITETKGCNLRAGVMAADELIANVGEARKQIAKAAIHYVPAHYARAMPADAALIGKLRHQLAQVTEECAALRARPQAVAEGVGLWSFLRNVLQQGAAIAADHTDKHYELYSARLDVAAKERESQVVAMLAASQSATGGA